MKEKSLLFKLIFLFLMLLKNSFSEQYVLSNIYFVYDGSILYSLSENGNVYSSFNLSAPAVAFFGKNLFVSGDNELNVYTLSAVPSLSAKINVTGIPFLLAGSDFLYAITREVSREGKVFIRAYVFDEQNNLIASSNIGYIPFSIKPAKKGVFLYSNDGIHYLQIEQKNVDNNITSAIKDIALFPSTEVKSNVAESPFGYVIGTFTGLLAIVSKDGKIIKSVNLDSSIQGIAISGNEARVLTSKSFYSLQLPTLNVIAKYKIKESEALKTYIDQDRLIAIYPNSVVVYRDRPRQGISVQGYPFEVVVKDNNMLIAYVSSSTKQKSFRKVDISKGCYISSYEEESGYIPFIVSGFTYPLLQQATVVVNDKFYSALPDNFGNFSLYIDPKDFDKDLLISCSVAGSASDVVNVKKNDKLPKDVFVVEPDITKADKGSVITFNVKDIKGLEVTNYNLTINGQTRTVLTPYFTVAFNNEGTYNIELKKEGFETYSRKIEVPTLTLYLLILGIILFIFLIAYVLYLIMSRSK